jgi:hypothetical protein
MLWLGPQENGQGLIYSNSFTISIFIVLLDALTLQGPASSALRYEAKAFDMNPQIENSSAWVYAGPPSPALDDAWGKLMKREHFLIVEFK